MFGKKNETPKIIEEKSEFGIFREYFELISETLIYVFFVMTFLLQSFVIPTGSMKNNILIGDHLLVNKIAYSHSIGPIDRYIFPQLEIKRGMIVTFKAPAEMDKEYVKRVIGLPGDTIRIDNRKVYVNGVPRDETYTRYENTDGVSRKSGDNFPFQKPRYINARGKTSYLPFYISDNVGFIDYKRSVALCEKFETSVVDLNNRKVFKVPAGHYFCMGDNRDHSYDSRFWGPVPAEYIIGKPWRVYWSYASTTEEYLTPGFMHKIKDLGNTFLNFFSKTRWDRTIKKIE
ncbi:MAG: signal peptidase I [bacterium]|nr:signal peptidase I [bacterium]